MPHYANQKRIQLGHLSNIAYTKGDAEQWLCPLKWEPIKEAMRVLKGNAFKLWMYLLSWEGQGYYDFSPAHLSQALNISDEGARNARDELVRKGYLIKTSQNGYEFFPISQTTVSTHAK